MSFDRLNGTLWAGDVGQDRFEEVNVIVRGGNYGWNLREGKHPRDPKSPRDSVEKFIEPVFEYPRVEGKSITGGLVYRGKRMPDLHGAYVYADFMSGNIWALRWDGKKATANHKIAHTSLLISSFGEDEAGEIYFTAFDGRIYRFRTPAKDERPVRFPQNTDRDRIIQFRQGSQACSRFDPVRRQRKALVGRRGEGTFLALPRNGSIVFKEKENGSFRSARSS